MPDCECLQRCPFFNDRMANMPTVAGLYKDKLCHGDYAQCARFRVFKVLGREAVPADLFPNELDRAAAVLAKRPA